jgi:arabinofuranosyltransferase
MSEQIVRGGSSGSITIGDEAGRAPRSISTIEAAIAVTIAIAVTSGFAWFLRDNRNDDAYITYRYAQNILAGHGPVFNPGETVLATTAPMHALLLALTGLVFSPDIVAHALILSTLAAIVMGLAVYVLLRDTLGWVGATLAAGSLLTNRLTYELFPLETILVAAACWTGLLAAHRRQYVLLGLLAAFAVALRADAALCFVALLLVLLRNDRTWPPRLTPGVRKALLLASALLLAWFTLIHAYYGSPLPSTAAAKTGWSSHGWTYASRLWDRGLAPTFGVETASLMATLLALWGTVSVFRHDRYRTLRAVPVWMLLHLGTYSALRIAWPHHWYYFPLTVGTTVLFAVGVVDLGRRIVTARPLPRRSLRLLRASSAVVLAAAWVSSIAEIVAYERRIASTFFIGGRDQLYRDAAAWLRENSSPRDTIAMAEPGTLAYHADRPVIDMMGLVTPEVGAAMRDHGGIELVRWVVERFEPSFVLLVVPASDAPPPRLRAAPEYMLCATFGRPGIDRGIVLYERPRA